MAQEKEIPGPVHPAPTIFTAKDQLTHVETEACELTEAELTSMSASEGHEHTDRTNWVTASEGDRGAAS